MVKRRRKKSDAWKNLKKAAARRPKRVLQMNPRRKKNAPDPLTQEEFHKTVQIVTERGEVLVILFKQAFFSAGFGQNKVYEMPKDKLCGAARKLRKTFERLQHNDYILKRSKEMRLASPIGRCHVLVGGSFKSPDAIIRLQKTQKQLDAEAKINERIERLFSGFH